MGMKSIAPEATVTRVGWCRWKVTGVEAQLEPGWRVGMELGSYLTRGGATRAGRRWVRRIRRKRAWADAHLTVT